MMHDRLRKADWLLADADADTDDVGDGDGDDTAGAAGGAGGAAAATKARHRCKWCFEDHRVTRYDPLHRHDRQGPYSL